MSNYDELLKKRFKELTPEEKTLLAQKAVKDAIARMHSKGIATLEVDEQGLFYDRHPDGRLTPIERPQQ